MATLTVAPNPAPPSTLVSVAGSGFANAKTRLLLDGAGATTNVFRPRKDGTFSVGITVSSTAKTQTLAAQQLSSTWTEKATTTITVAAPLTPVPPTGDLPGWRLAFSDEFTTWDPSRYFVYPETWLDTSKNGYRNSPGGITSDGSKLRCHLFSANGMSYGAHFVPRVNGTGDLLSMRVEFRMRADLMPGFKAAPLLWPQSNTWPGDGEIDWPEGDFDGTPPAAFMHRQGGTSGSDQDWYSAPSTVNHRDWHTYAIEWIAGTSCQFFVDGVSIGKSTSRVPNTPMHFVMQLETALTSTKPDPSVSGYVELDWLKVWARA